MNEQEQLEILKSYWKQYGKKAITLVIAVIFGIYGWLKWQEKREHDKERASSYYETFLAELEQQNKAAIEAQAKYILTNFPNSPYSLFVVFTLAKKAVEENQLDAAVKQLEQAITLAKGTPFDHVARLRLARVFLAKKQPKDALQVLATSETPGFYQALYEELKGDCYALEGKPEEARRAYRLALAKGLPGKPKNMILQMKLDNLGG